MKIICILGPTAVGKTALSIKLAKLYNGEIINADSTQVYKNMDVATAKVTEDEKENVKHHLIDIKEIDEDYTIYNYQKDCRLKIDEIIKKGKTPILVGGTGLYIKSALFDYKFEEEKKHDFSNLTDTDLYNKLVEVDKNNKIHINNRKRVERAYSYYLETGNKFSEKEVTDKLLYDVLFIGLTTNRDILYDKINKRVDVMVNNGLLKEAKYIYDTNIRSKAVLTPIGYKELFDYFDNKDSLENCLDKIKQNSRRYAKRQYTFFNNQFNIKWFNTNYENFDITLNEVNEYIKNRF